MERIKPPILITGVERSGATIIGKIIHMAGAFPGKINPMNENPRIKALVADYYRMAGADPSGQFPLPNAGRLHIPTDWRKAVVDIMREDGWDGRGPFVVKGSHCAQIWPVWHYAFPEARWIIVRRRTGDIITSCTKTAYMKAYKNPETLTKLGLTTEAEGWKYWVHQHEARFNEMINIGIDAKVIWPERMVDGDYRQIYEMLKFLGLPWKDEIITTIDPLLYKTRKKIQSCQRQ